MDRKHRWRPAAVFCRNLSHPNIHLSSSCPSSSPRISDNGLKQRPTCHEIRCKVEGKLRRNSTVHGQDATRETFPQFFCEGTRDLPGRFQASLSKKASDVRSIPGSRASTNSRPWRSGLLRLPRQPTLALLPRAIRPCSTHGPSSNSSRWSCSKLSSFNLLTRNCAKQVYAGGFDTAHAAARRLLL